MYWQPVVRCKNPDCPTPSAARIRLPYPDPPMVTSDQPMWPADGWKLHLICRDCDHWYIYGKNDIQWAKVTLPLADQSGFTFWSVDIECGEPGCTSRTQWHVLDNSGMSEIEVGEFVLRADPVAVCENDHAFGISGVKSQSAKMVSSV